METRFFWERFKKPITAVLLIVLLAVIVFTGYRFYLDRRAAAASALLASAKSAQAYQQVIADYPNTAAAADAYRLRFLTVKYGLESSASTDVIPSGGEVSDEEDVLQIPELIGEALRDAEAVGDRTKPNDDEEHAPPPA